MPTQTFKSDHRQRVAQHVVEITGDALALGNGGQPFDLLVGPSQQGVLTLALARARGLPRLSRR